MANFLNSTLSSYPAQTDFFVWQHENGQAKLVLRGSWTAFTLQTIQKEFLALTEQPNTLVVDEISNLDTSGALFINEMLRSFRKKKTVSLTCSNTKYQILLDTTAGTPTPLPPKPTKNTIFLAINRLGKEATGKLWVMSELLGFLGLYIVTLFRMLLHPKRMRWTALCYQMQRTGISAVPIVTLLTFLIGMVVAYMGAEELSRMGAQSFSIKLLEVTIMREMAVLITAIIVAGRSSSAFTAEIGAMVANEEISALRSMGLSPMELLVVPRVLAITLTLPLLVFLADVVGVAGGCLALWYAMDITPLNFLNQYQNVALTKNFFAGLIKSPFFAVMIGLCGCYQGFKATSSASSVGYLTTLAVVQAIFIVIIMDALFAIFFITIDF